MLVGGGPIRRLEEPYSTDNIEPRVSFRSHLSISLESTHKLIFA